MDRIVDVAIERAVEGLDRLWSYRAEARSDRAGWTGRRVEVPLGHGVASAVVMRERAGPEEEASGLKALSRELAPYPVLTPALAELALWMSRRYLAYIGQVVRAMVPPAVRSGRPVREAPPRLWKAGTAPPTRAARQRMIWEWLDASGPVPRESLLAAFPGAQSLLRTMIAAGRMFPASDDPSIPSQPPPLTPEQTAAAEALAGGGGTFLLEGVTGSGKTEVYLNRIARALEVGRQALVLVPEIALTPQTVARFRDRFGRRVGVWHSGLGDGERARTWQMVREGATEVLVGARSAVFLPFPRLGLIVLDEEHETTYKQDEHPRYHAREVAEERARLEGATVILGSATPSVDTALRARRGEVGWLRLTARVGSARLPTVHIVDMREELKRGNRAMFSAMLRARVDEALSRREQVILFLNRRGYATFILCRDCGTALGCPRCAVTLTFHQRENRLRCHYCFYEAVPPETCPRCRSRRIRFFGTGTERVVEAVAEAWPTATVMRADRDTLIRRESHEALWRAFSAHEADVLVGTQMIAKGMDWPEVTVVGILAADLSLNFPDFRAGERTFELLVQASGRAGRGERPGTVVIQTYNPDHYAIRHAVHADYERFYQEEIEARRQAGYPPFVDLWLLEARASKDAEAGRAAALAAEELRRELGDRVVVLGPAPAPIARLKTEYRYHLLIKAAKDPDLAEAVGRALRRAKGVQITVDPYFML